MIFDLMKDEKPIIKVIGVGGGGSNAVNFMYDHGIVGVEFAICNTDSQALEASKVPLKIQLGANLTEGRGAGSKPQIGKLAGEESLEEIKKFLEGTKMLFLTAGMGGGTGTGAAPIIAKAAQEMDILTVGIVTLPFTFEGRRRSSQGADGLAELKKNVDTLIVISNDKLRQIYGNLTITQAFSKADSILTVAAKGIAEIITVPGYVNVDFEDVNTVMRDSGVAIMGIATAEGEDRAKTVVDEALNSPLLEDNDIRGAQHILLNITSGTKEVTMDEIFEITEFVQEEAGYGTDLIWGNCFDESLGEKISVTIIATGFEANGSKKTFGEQKSKPKVVSLDDDERSLSEIGFQKNKSTNTVEFNDITETVKKYQKYSYNEPYIKDEVTLSEEKTKRRQPKEVFNKNKYNSPKVFKEMEDVPAYLRKKVELDDVQHSSEETMSNWVVSDDVEKPIINTNNSYLHDNVD